MRRDDDIGQTPVVGRVVRVKGWADQSLIIDGSPPQTSLPQARCAHGRAKSVRCRTARRHSGKSVDCIAPLLSARWCHSLRCCRSAVTPSIYPGRAQRNKPFIEELFIRIIPTTTYNGHELRAYAQQQFPPFDDPYAQGARRFSSVVRIDAIPSNETHARRYATVFDAASPASFDDAIDLAMQFGKDIVDGKVQAAAL